MNDFLPDEAGLLEALEAHLLGWLAAYGYRNMRTPVLEKTALFRRGIGEVTDIVEKEMFSFTDRLNADELTMRPEFTAGMVRAVVEHSLLYNGPQRVFAMGPVFRHERPQSDRYRQFHQIDVEALGFDGPDVDAEQIVMLDRLWRRLKLTDVRLEINSLGSPAERQAHRQALIAYFEQHAGELDEDARRRMHSNPLRILDSKNPAMQDLVNAAPRLSEHLGAASLAHFEQLQDYLRDARVAYTINPRLVRGLDYYNLTVFEWITGQLGAQGTICGGGRYDGLIELLGGKSEPAVGFAIGVERLLKLVKQSGALGRQWRAAMSTWCTRARGRKRRAMPSAWPSNCAAAGSRGHPALRRRFVQVANEKGRRQRRRIRRDHRRRRTGRRRSNPQTPARRSARNRAVATGRVADRSGSPKNSPKNWKAEHGCIGS